MIARILIWNLYDSKTTLEELREHLPALPEGDVWIANEAQDRFGITSFAVLMGVCGAACIAAAASALRAVGAGVDRTWLALLAIGVAPLVLGSLFDTRFDLWPTLLAVGALAALVRERAVLSGALLGL